jgi:hypothetical protein
MPWYVADVAEKWSGVPLLRTAAWFTLLSLLPQEKPGTSS